MFGLYFSKFNRVVFVLLFSSLMLMSCSSSSDDGDGVTPTPEPSFSVEFVSPSTVNNILQQSIKIYTMDLNSTASEVRIQLSSTTLILPFSSPSSFNVIEALVPAGIAVGSWSVYVTDSNGEEVMLENALNVSDILSLELSSITEEVIYAPITNDVEIMATSGLTEGSRVYIQTAGTSAIELTNTYFVDPTRIRATVPANVQLDLYDVIVVDLTGTAGMLMGVLSITDTLGPQIQDVFPKSLASDQNTLRLEGEGFTAQDSAVLACKDEFDQVDFVAGTIALTDSTSMSIEFDTSSLSTPQRCHVLLSNVEVMTTKSSAISLLSPSYQQGEWTSVSSLNEPRNSPTMVYAQLSSERHSLYVIGGDDTNRSHAMNSVESMPLSDFDTPNMWTIEKNTLPVSVTNTGAVTVGEFVYVVGGYDGTTVMGNVYRAQILSKEKAPAITDVSIAINKNSDGLGHGLYYYQIAATFPVTDTSNPLGESAVGRIVSVNIPSITSGGLETTLQWEVVAGANGYRIYRKPTPLSAFPALELLGTTVGESNTTFIDTGLSTTVETPAYEDSLGKWHAVTALATPREHHSVSIAPDPDTANQFFIYAFAGKDENGDYLDDYEYAAITLSPDGTQSMSTWQAGSVALPAPRAEHSTWFVNGDDSSTVPDGEYWLYVGPGQDGTGAVNNVDAFKVKSTGELNTSIAVFSVPTGPRGYIAVSGSEMLYLYGGAEATSSGASTRLTDVTPEIENWNNTGAQLNASRIYAGSSQTDASMFTAGGTNIQGAAMSTVEYAIK